jgi:hypothetical protein
MAKKYILQLHSIGAIVGAGIAAGVVATLAQILLWLIFTDEFPAVLMRDARLTAAMAMGSRVLPPSFGFDADVWLVASFIHFALSVCYAALLAPFAARWGIAMSMLAGAAFGLLIYAINLYGFTEMFPWFTQARGPITAAAHVVFGMTAIFTYRFICFRNARS